MQHPNPRKGAVHPISRGVQSPLVERDAIPPRGCNIPLQKGMRHPLRGDATPPRQGWIIPLVKGIQCSPSWRCNTPQKEGCNQPLWQGMRCLPRMGKQYLLTLEDTIACAAWWGQWGGVPEHPSANRNPPCDTRALRHEKSNRDGVENHPRTNDASIMQVNALCSTGTHATSHRRRRIHAANRVAKLPATQGT